MKRTKNLTLAIGLTLAAVVTAGCESADPLEFNDNIVEQHRRIARSARDFRKASEPLLRAPPVAVKEQEVRDAYNRLLATLTDVRTRVSQEKVPKSEQAGNFHSAYMTYLQEQEDLLKDDRDGFARIVQVALDPDPRVTPEAKKTAIQGHYKSILEKDYASLKTLKQAQKDFASASVLKLVPTRKLK